MSTSVSTDGWDMIASATQGSINAALTSINAARPAPVSVSKDIKLGDSHLSISIDASFGPLQINALQQGLTLMEVIVTITDGTITLPINNKKSLDGLELVLQMALTYVESELKPTSGSNYDFVIDFTNPDAFNKATLENLPSWLEDDYFFIAVLQTMLLEILVSWATENPSIVVATVNLGDVSSGFPALVPSQAFYSFSLDESNPDETPLSVLMLTTGTEQGGFNTGTSYIPDSSNASVLISNNLLMSGILLPAVAEAFGVPESDFAISKGVLSLKVDSVTVTSNGDSIDISEFSIQINSSNELAISMQATTSVWGIIDVDMSLSANLAFVITDASDGSQTISLEVQGEPDTSVNLHLPWWLSWASWILILIMPLVGIFVGLFVSLTNLVLGALGLGASSKIESTFAGYALAQVSWPAADIVEIDSIELPDLVQIGATLAPDSKSA